MQDLTVSVTKHLYTLLAVIHPHVIAAVAQTAKFFLIPRYKWHGTWDGIITDAYKLMLTVAINDQLS